MFKLWAAILKDVKILTRDKVGLTLMFVMPIILAVVITSLQAGALDLVNKNQIPVLICNKDTGAVGKQYLESLEKSGRFIITISNKNLNEQQIAQKMNDIDALMAISIPADFTKKIKNKASEISNQALNDFGAKDATKLSAEKFNNIYSIKFYFHPALQASYRQSVQNGLRSALQVVESKQILNALYLSLNEKPIPKQLEEEIVNNQVKIDEIPVSKDGAHVIPNTTQHNIPAWTIFAMFFIVTSLGSNIIKEKMSGSFVRLKTLPTNYWVALLSKQITYVCVCLLQVIVIFSIGMWLFPVMGLPKLNIPYNVLGLLVVSIVCAWCAISYAQLVGVMANSQEQANGFGSISVVLLAAIGGILVPSFAMPHGLQFMLKLSPMFWCLKAYYNLFLEAALWSDILKNIIPILCIGLILQIISFWKLKRF